MLITKELNIRIAGNVGHYYKINKIDVVFNDINKLPIELVNPQSHLLVDAKCDVCGNEVKIQYRRYNQSISRGGYYTCSSKCSSEKRKMVFTTHFRQSDDWKIKNMGDEKEKRKNTIFDDFLISNPTVVGQNDDNFIVRCGIHGDNEIPKGIFSNRKIIGTELCVKCKPIESNVSGKEILLYKLIKEIYNGNIIQSYKIERKEIDVYLPELKIGFEFNGLRWHSEQFKNKDYHIEKTKLCKKNGIRLIHIFEDDFDYKLDIVKSVINNILGESVKIHGRQTELKVIKDKNIIKEFLHMSVLKIKGGYWLVRWLKGWNTYLWMELYCIIRYCTHLRRVQVLRTKILRS